MIDNKNNQNNQNNQNKSQPGPLTKEWNDSEVKLLKKWGELSASYRVLHDRAHRFFKYRNYYFTIPVIIFSTILGTASFSQDTFPSPYKSYIPMGIGSINIISGIITTIAQFTRVSELSEANRVASISYGKFSRNIATELSLPPELRSYSGIDFVQICRSEFDRLVEQSPIIPINILNEFMKEIEDEDIEKPDIMKVARIEEYKPTKEEKAAKIIANAFQTMHNRSKDKNKSRVQKMVELVEKKGLNIMNRATSNILPDNQHHGINNMINQQIESRQTELKEINQNNVVGKILQNSPFGAMKKFNFSKELNNSIKNIVNEQTSKNQPKIKSLVDKAKKELDNDYEYDSISNEVINNDNVNVDVNDNDNVNVDVYNVDSVVNVDD